MATYDDFTKIEIKIGQIKRAEEIEDSDKLLLLSVDLGEDEPRTVVSGIKKYFDSPGDLVDKKCAFVTNLDPRPIMGHESQAMIMAAHNEDDPSEFSLLEVSDEMKPGAKIN